MVRRCGGVGYTITMHITYGHMEEQCNIFLQLRQYGDGGHPFDKQKVILT